MATSKIEDAFQALIMEVFMGTGLPDEGMFIVTMTVQAEPEGEGTSYKLDRLSVSVVEEIYAYEG